MVVADIVRLQSRYRIAGFLDDVNLNRKGEPFCQSTVLGGGELLSRLMQQEVSHVLIAVGDPFVRLTLAERCMNYGLQLATAVHPAAIVAADVVIGSGTVVAAGAVVAPGVALGLCSLINHLASVDHGCTLDDGATISPGVHLAGDVKVGRATWVGIGASVRERVSIGAHSVIGAGSAVVGDIPSGCMAYGVPARVARKLKQVNQDLAT